MPNRGVSRASGTRRKCLPGPVADLCLLRNRLDVPWLLPDLGLHTSDQPRICSSPRAAYFIFLNNFEFGGPLGIFLAVLW